MYVLLYTCVHVFDIYIYLFIYIYIVYICVYIYMGRNGGVQVIEVGVAGKKDAQAPQEVPSFKALLRPLRPHTLVAA